MPRELDGFVLTRQWRDDDDGVTLTFWLASDEGPVRVVQRGCEAVTFVERGAEARCDRRKEVELSSLLGKPIDALYFKSQRRLAEERDRLRRGMHACLEADLKPQDRFLMERFITSGCRVKGEPRRRRGHLEVHNASMKATDYEPKLSVVSFDIETDGIDGPIISISLFGDALERVVMVGEGRDLEWLSFVRDERALLMAFFDQVRQLDPDVLIGWNVVEFDLSYIGRRCDELNVRFALGRGGERARVLEAMRPGQLPIARVPGRVVLDGIATLRTATYSFESFSLEDVAQALLGRGKLIGGDHERVEAIQALYRSDPEALAAYNLQDSRLVWEIFEHTSLLSFALQRQRMTGLPMDRAGGSVAAFDFLYLPRLHREGYVAFDAGGAAQGQGQSSPGGYVLPSQPGLYRNVLVLDFKSLYPSIIRTFRIDPLGMAFPGADPIEGFEGASFSRERSILPALITTLWKERDGAKADDNQPLSRAIKILMNSFYGVLGTPACRFFSPRLASSITRRGHQIITASRDWLEERGRRVIYGDTDSLFVHLGDELSADECKTVGRELARDLNGYWRARVDEEHRVESHLEIEFETHYDRFFMPTLRGSDEGSAKRYAGLVSSTGSEPRVVVKGLEAVRTDWTPLARRFQRELLRRVFLDEAIEEYTRGVRERMLAGELDEELVYTKRLRRGLDEYVANVPPHVKAARMLDRPGRSVSYVMTTRGPEPVERRSAPIDYRHYLERQLAPAADGLLHALDTSFEAIAGDQLALF